MNPQTGTPPSDNRAAETMRLLSGRVDNALKRDLLSLYSGAIPAPWQYVRSGSGNRIYTNGVVFVKIFLPASQLSILRRLRVTLLGGSDVATLRANKKMRANGFLVPDTLAHGQIEDSRFIVSLKAPGSTIYEIVTRLTPQQRRKFINSLAMAVADLHSKHIRHGDLNPYNILAEQQSNNAWQFHFLDNDKNRFYVFGKQFRLANLSQLNFWGREGRLHRRDRLRFLLRYIEHANKDYPYAEWVGALSERFENRLANKRGNQS